ncbi:serine acetyltransferase [Bradyrhizobium japonicum]|uniref:serine acetyltransferase n=1 Tax=Bradyrhizobium japonicum TaxID=375 RepID=UPI001BA59A78|nr:serine acetyltransferase [Bradyrhizobium japonicum]MBR0995454.1 serine acetyltransferase [Bradyrhizobium japonicum]
MDNNGHSSSEISATTPDWSREAVTAFWQPSRQLLKTIRGYQRHRNRRGVLSQLARRRYALEHRFWSVVTGADIPLTCQIGGGLMMPHPNGIVIHPDAIIGVNCLLFQQVTLGTRRGGGVPILEGHVDVGAGAKVVGTVIIPAHSEVAANAVVTSWPPKARGLAQRP